MHLASWRDSDYLDDQTIVLQQVDNTRITHPLNNAVQANTFHFTGPTTS